MWFASRASAIWIWFHNLSTNLLNGCYHSCAMLCFLKKHNKSFEIMFNHIHSSIWFTESRYNCTKWIVEVLLDAWCSPQCSTEKANAVATIHWVLSKEKFTIWYRMRWTMNTSCLSFSPPNLIQIIFCYTVSINSYCRMVYSISIQMITENWTNANA